MHDVACIFAHAAVCSKDAQKQLAQTSLKENEGNFFRCVRARANDAKIVRSRDAQCNTEESL